jgi:hypothetical protein
MKEVNYGITFVRVARISFWQEDAEVSDLTENVAIMTGVDDGSFLAECSKSYE